MYRIKEITSDWIYPDQYSTRKFIVDDSGNKYPLVTKFVGSGIHQTIYYQVTINGEVFRGFSESELLSELNNTSYVRKD